MIEKSKIFGWFTVIYLSLFCTNSYAQEDFQLWIKADLAALILENTALYPDSSFFDNPVGTLMGESLVRIRRRSGRMHDDDAQKQQYFWYQVESSKGKRGWVFGDALATSIPTLKLPPKARALHKTYQTLREPIGRSFVWFAEVQGRDRKKNGSFTEYAEYLLLFTNPIHGNTVFSIIGHKNPFSRSVFYDVSLQNISDDNYPDLVWYSERTDSFGQFRELHIKQQQGVSFDYIFQADDRLEDSEPPFSRKQFNIDPPLVRMEYIRGSFKNDWFPELSNSLDPRTIFLQLGSETQVFKPLKKQFEILYPKTETALIGKARNTLQLKERIHAVPFASLPPGSEVTIYGIVRERNYFLVGQKEKVGYVPAKDVSVISGWQKK